METSISFPQYSLSLSRFCDDRLHFRFIELVRDYLQMKENTFSQMSHIDVYANDIQKKKRKLSWSFHRIRESL